MIKNISSLWWIYKHVDQSLNLVVHDIGAIETSAISSEFVKPLDSLVPGATLRGTS